MPIMTQTQNVFTSIGEVRAAYLPDPDPQVPYLWYPVPEGEDMEGLVDEEDDELAQPSQLWLGR